MAFSLASRKQAAIVGGSRTSARSVRPSRALVVAPRAALELKSPPYALDALEPHMSKQTLEFHW